MEVFSRHVLLYYCTAGLKTSGKTQGLSSEHGLRIPGKYNYCTKMTLLEHLILEAHAQVKKLWLREAKY
jgi:hypothetical protein